MGFWAIAAPIIGAAIDNITGRRAARKAPNLAGHTAYQENYKGFLGRLEAAKAAGIHPALALGSNVGGSGAPQMVGSDFRGALADAAATATRQREWKQETEMRKAAERNQRNIERQRLAQEARLNEAQIKHIEKQSSWIDEQIAASAEQRLRESQRRTHSTASGAHDMTSSGGGGRVRIDNTTGEVVYKPNEVTRHRGGQAQGEQPGYEWIVLNGNRVKVPFGTTQNHEPSEIFQMYRDIQAALEPEGLIGQQVNRFKKWLREPSGRVILPHDYSSSPRRRFRNRRMK